MDSEFRPEPEVDTPGQNYYDWLEYQTWLDSLEDEQAELDYDQEFDEANLELHAEANW